MPTLVQLVFLLARLRFALLRLGGLLPSCLNLTDS